LIWLISQVRLKKKKRQKKNKKIII
jgi:hypothetical protein